MGELTRPRRLWPVAATAGLAVLLAACTPTEPEPTESPSSPPAQVATSVFFTLDTRAGFRLASELRDVDAAQPIHDAVETMIAGPQDPDYATTWNPATQVLGVTEDSGNVEVDLSGDARTANVGSELAALMIQQLVHTITAATAADNTVELLIDGEQAGELWGAVVWDGPIGRADPLNTRLLVQIDEPRQGATVTSPVTVTGEAAVFEGTVLWRVLDDEGTETQSGFTNTSEGQALAPFSFDVDLGPGTHTIEVFEDDVSGGEAGAPMVDSKEVTVD